MKQEQHVDGRRQIDRLHQEVGQGMRDGMVSELAAFFEVKRGAPRAQPFVMPGDDAMPSDSSDEAPNIWVGAFNAGSGGSADDYWIVTRGDWAWSKFGAPRARSARNG